MSAFGAEEATHVQTAITGLEQRPDLQRGAYPRTPDFAGRRRCGVDTNIILGSAPTMPFGGTAASHMGSKFTADANSMAPVMEELHARGLAFLDSRPPRPARAFGSRSPTVFRTLLATCFSTTIRAPPRLQRARANRAGGCRKSKGRGSPSSRSARWFAVAWQRKLNPSTDLPSLASWLTE